MIFTNYIPITLICGFILLCHFFCLSYSSQAVCKKKAPQLNTSCEKIEKATYELLSILLPGGADDLEHVFALDLVEPISIKAVRRQSTAIGLAPVDEVEEELRPGEIAYQREQQKKRELYQEANDLMHHFNRSVLGALIRCTRTTLESIKRRVSSPSTLNYGESDEKRKMDHRPAFKVKLALAVPQVSLKPGLDEIQAALNSAVQQVVSVHKSVYQWRQGRKNQDQTDLAAASGVLGAQSRVLAAKSGVLEAPSGVLASKSGNLASVSVVAKPPSKKNFYKSVSEHKEVSKLISMLTSTVSSAKALVTQSLDYFKKYEELWNMEREEHMAQFMETNPDLSDFEERMKFYVNIEETVVEEVEQMNVGALAVLTGKKKVTFSINSKIRLLLL